MPPLWKVIGNSEGEGDITSQSHNWECGVGGGRSKPKTFRRRGMDIFRGNALIAIFIYTLQSVSAYAPICNPVECPWGQKAFAGYLGSNKETWKASDAHS